MRVCAALPGSGISCFTWLSAVSQMAALHHLDHKRTFYDAQKMKYLEMHFSGAQVFHVYAHLKSFPTAVCNIALIWRISPKRHGYPQPCLAFDVGAKDLQNQHSYLQSCFPALCPTFK